MTVAIADGPFEQAPPIGTLRLFGLVKANGFNAKRRALLFVLAGWPPLILLALVQTALLSTDDFTSLLLQTGVHARYLIAAPVLVLAQVICVPQLDAIVRHFIRGNIVGDTDLRRFDEAVAATRRLLESMTAEICVIVLAYVVVVAATLFRPIDELPTWALSHGLLTPIYSPAGWWHMLVSLPLLLLLILGWMWRVVVWARLLWRISRLDLRLVASHPDRSAGLRFVGDSVRAFSVVALGLAVIVAGRWGQLVLVNGAAATPNAQLVGVMLAIMALFVAPVFVFTPTLVRAWRRGTFEYDAFATRVGHTVEQKWLRARGDLPAEALEVPDFSATSDLYSVVSHVRSMRVVPLGLKELSMFAVTIVAPFVPILILALPFDVIWSFFSGLLL
jgi:hypothetical protein